MEKETRVNDRLEDKSKQESFGSSGCASLSLRGFPPGSNLGPAW